MKKLLNIFICLLPFSLMAQNIDRSKAPNPGKVPLIQVGNPVKFTLPNGLKVFVVKNTKLPRVVASLNFDVDGFKEGDKAGLAEMAGQLAKRGTVSKTKEQLDEAGNTIKKTIEGKRAEEVKKESRAYKNGALLGLAGGILSALYFKKNIWLFSILGVALGGYVAHKIHIAKKGNNEVNPM